MKILKRYTTCTSRVDTNRQLVNFEKLVMIRAHTHTHIHRFNIFQMTFNSWWHKETWMKRKNKYLRRICVRSKVIIYFYMDYGGSCSCINEHSFVQLNTKTLNFGTKTHSKYMHSWNKFILFIYIFVFHFSRFFQQIKRISYIFIDVFFLLFFFVSFQDFCECDSNE